jgi:uncharacterized membrane protein HdeD (DUF308 family)
MMKCYYHPEVDAVATCMSCGKAICQSCAVDVTGKVYCQQCLASGTIAKGRAVETIPTNPLAIISLILGILGLLGCACGGSIGGILFGVPASITGWIARKQLLQAQQEQQGMQLATIGLVLGIAEVIMSVVLLILFGAAIGWDVIRTLLRQSSY